ncbi:hypothetical protein H6P81_012334 [Aristolochia fimbriata]|uniref:DYW domain-containing protein n=1 Tax=Aristolochia fimbriata TaxID=158543 RepID=A0AAV7EEL1_ARIFI|nr:hypothetical protein H6P81_012334 [Aristolochia fimbriata]
MSSLPLPPSYSALKSASFNKLPAGVSLSSYSSTKQSETIPTGVIENVQLVSLCKQGKLRDAHEFLNVMDANGIVVDGRSYECLFETCRNMNALSFGRLVHLRLRKDAGGHDHTRSLSPSLRKCLIEMYLHCGCIEDARKVFDEMPEKDLPFWKKIISAYAQSGFLADALELFLEMHNKGIEPTSDIYLSLLGLLSTSSGLGLGQQIHSHLYRSGLLPNAYIESSLFHMYTRCGCLDNSVLIFERMKEKNVVHWTDLMVGFTQEQKYKEALALFQKIILQGADLDQFVFSIALKACSKSGNLDFGKQIHAYVAKLAMGSEVSVGTPLVDFYVKCGHLKEASLAFDRISNPNDVSWSSIITGFAQTGKFEESLKLFKNLRREGSNLNSFIYTSMFQACSGLADLSMGSHLHCDAIKRGLIARPHGESALVTMYSRCGCLDDAHQAFELIEEPDTVAWTAMIAGVAYHGHAYKALDLFDKMLSKGVRPNSITFVAIFTACSHAGLVTEAMRYFSSMGKDYNVQPSIDHYNCMLDIYCRAGQLEEAFEFVQGMEFEPVGLTWKILLSGCRAHGNVKLGKIAGDNLLKMSPEDTAGYVLYFNLYASAGRWEDAAYIRKLMNENSVRKELSCSWITIKGKVHRFIVGDRHHPLTVKIYAKLKELKESFANLKSTLPINDISNDFEERNEQLHDHSERVAISFGLISAPPSVPIAVFKNLRRLLVTMSLRSDIASFGISENLYLVYCQARPINVGAMTWYKSFERECSSYQKNNKGNFI